MSRTIRSTARRSAQTGTFEFIQRTEHSWPVQLLAGAVRFRAELTCLAVVLTAWALLNTYLGSDQGAWLILAGLALVAAVVPHTRRYIIRRAWCVLTRHRLRACLVSARVMTHDGLVPRLLWARPIPVGARVWLFLRVGLAPSHLERVTDEIAAACFAREARVQAHNKLTALVRVDVVRHDPLSGAIQVPSDLLTGRNPGTETGADVIPLPDRTTLQSPAGEASGTDGASPTAATTDAPAARRGKTRTTPTTAAAPESAEPVAVRGRSGEDVSDYV